MLGLGNSIISGVALGDIASEIASGNLAVLPNIEHWWKHNTGFQDSGGAFPDDEEQVVLWPDQIGSENFTGSSDLPVYESTTGTLQFNGAAKVLTIASGTSSDIALDGDFAIYVRIKFATTPNNTDIFFKDTDAANAFFRANSATVIRAKISSGAADYTVPTMGTSDFYNIGIERVSDSVRVYLDGTESSTTAKTNTNTWNIDTLKGGQQDFFSTMIIVKGSGLSDEHRSSLNTYLDTL